VECVILCESGTLVVGGGVWFLCRFFVLGVEVVG